ncbi:unnamed protein product [Microthlaspi erraticum]|uniref:Uncharacterized protein n=1 Tax=Microthlaspi erraticum TaxID=1685480 RepID=A0A6D2KMF3_9BRAS|nr:unnamed protein product [Microthlaspi erraticum]
MGYGRNSMWKPIVDVVHAKGSQQETLWKLVSIALSKRPLHERHVEKALKSSLKSAAVFSLENFRVQAVEEKSGVFGEIFEVLLFIGLLFICDSALFIVFLFPSVSIHCQGECMTVGPRFARLDLRPGPRLWTSADSGESVAPSVAIASVTQSVSVASEASVDASVGLGAGAAPGWGGAPAQGLDDLVVGLLTQLLARFPPVVPQGLREYLQWQRCSRGLRVCSAAGCGFVVPPILDMMGHMQRIGTPYFEGGVSRGGECVRDWSGISSLSDCLV